MQGMAVARMGDTVGEAGYGLRLTPLRNEARHHNTTPLGIGLGALYLSTVLVSLLHLHISNFSPHERFFFCGSSRPRTESYLFFFCVTCLSDTPAFAPLTNAVAVRKCQMPVMMSMASPFQPVYPFNRET